MATYRTKIIQVRLDEKTIINVEAENLGGEEYVAVGHLPDFNQISSTIETIAKAVVTMLQKIGPHKGSVEFGLQIAVEAGNVTALLVKGSSEASLKITLEWEERISAVSTK